MVDWAMRTGMPLVYAYHLFCGNVFLNTMHEDAVGFERVGNTFLAPFQYLFVGQIVASDGSVAQRYLYQDDDFVIKTLTSVATLPVSIALGSALKGIGYLSEGSRTHHQMIVRAKKATHVVSQKALYKELGITVGNYLTAEKLPPPAHKRRPQDECHMDCEQAAFKEIVNLLTEAQIPFWIDCGTLLGAYRYGGVIPWDKDIDIGILALDSQNVARVLKKLDPSKYVIQDWASRDKPGTYLKVYVRETGRLIDIYHARLDEDSKTMHTVCSNLDCILMLKRWKIREGRFERPVPIDYFFPLKQGVLDGVVVPVPNKTVAYLKHHYGENIEPAKIYDETTGQYERDLSHPYWELPYVH
ncbi:MAG: hypothetical protein SP1CHLAM54_11440 [Chlamydiia bacterium]|nr:hypothetical protein [Chlamydiia bacterium]MCH9616047.1 hypothetical protein [Chlamydiia bacterium]MCH9629070.1 hypothetical protein [Chlamydiia bacterium]